MSRFISYVLFIFLEIILIIIIIFLSIKINDLKNSQIKGIQYVTKIDKNYLEFSSRPDTLKYFYEPKSNEIFILHNDWLGFDPKYVVNADTLFEEKDYSTVKPVDTYRILSIGDSFVFGQFVDEKRNFSKLLDIKLNNELRCKKISKFEVINLGVGGYDIEYTVNRFMKRGIKYSPDLVIWLISDWNFNKINEYEIPLIEEYKKEDFKIYNSVTKIYEAPTKARKYILSKYGLENIIQYQLNTLQKLNETYKGKILILTFPSIHKIFNDLLTNFVKNNSFYTYYSNLFDINKDAKFLFPDNHPNEEGHKKIAEDIFQYLKKNYLTDCN
jgi:hypothetical protein